MPVEFINVKYRYDMEMYYDGPEPTFEAMMGTFLDYVTGEFGKLSIAYKPERSTYIVSWTDPPRTNSAPSMCVSFYGDSVWKAAFKLWVFLEPLGGGREGLLRAEEVLEEKEALVKQKLKELMTGTRT